MTARCRTLWVITTEKIINKAKAEKLTNLNTASPEESTIKGEVFG